MKQLNRILLIFLAFSFLTIYGGWRFIHSRKFSERASDKVSKILTKKFGAKLSFTGVDFAIFPPSTIFKNVHIEKMDPSSADIDLNVEELTVSFTYSSFLSSNLEIDDLILKDGALSIVSYKTKDLNINWKNLNLDNIYNKYSEMLLQSPLQLNIARLENINLQVDGSNLLIDSLSIAPHHKDLRLKASTSQVHIEHKIKDLADITLDKAEVFVHLTKDQWELKSLQLEKDQHEISSTAVVSSLNNRTHLKTSTDFNFNIESLIPLYAQVPKELLEIKGDVSGTLVSHGDLLNPDAELTIAAKGFKSNWIQLENFTAGLKKKRNLLSLEKFLANNFKERYEQIKPQAIFDLSKNTFMRLRLPVYIQDAFSNTFLYTLRETLESLKGYFTGNLEIVWDGEKVHFDIREKLIAKDFKLLSTTKKPILENAGFELSETILSLDKNYTLSVLAKVAMNNTLLKASGEITGKDINISIVDSKIDLKAFGPIAGIPTMGQGAISAEIYGPFKNVKFDFISDLNNFSLLDLNFGKVNSEFSLSLKNLQLTIDQLSGVYNQSVFSADGSLSFGEKSGMDLKIDFKKTNFSDARKMYGLVFNHITLPFIPEFDFATTYRIQGGYDVASLKIDGDLKGSDLKVYGEEAENLSMGFSLQKNILKFKDVKILKSRGALNANVNINLANNYTELEGGLQGLRLHDFNFYQKLKIEYDGDMVVDFDGNGTKENFSTRYKVKINSPLIQNISASPSSALIFLNKDDVTINANLLSGKARVESNLKFKTRQLSLKSNIETANIRELLALISGHNMFDKSLTGKIKAEFNSQFNIDTFSISKFILFISQFNIKKDDLNLSIDPTFNTMYVDNGIVKSGDLRFNDKDDFLKIKANNPPSGGISFNGNFSLKTSLLEIVTDSISKAIGVIKGSLNIVIDKKLTVTKLEISGGKNSLKIKNIPGSITDLEYLFIKKGNVFEMPRLVGKYGEGDLKASGNFIFDDFYPQVNIEYKIERSTIPLFKRSSILVSSNGSITGTDLPYKVNGKISLLFGEFYDDPSDFTKKNKVNLEAFKKYLPRKTTDVQKGYLSLNMLFDTVNPFVIKNNLVEIYAKANGQLLGDVLSPEINAHIEVVPTTSKFKFKGHDFLLSQGYVDIKDRGKIRNSDLKFIGISKINDYEVKFDINGSIEKSNINLSSEPPLAQEDLVGLLTLGVTSDMSKNLEASDRKSVTTVGVGALLVDQLKINEDLNSTLGLNLSVLPEFKEDETSLVSGKSATSEGTSSKLKTATKIKISKPINKLVDVSVSSTVGGSIEPTQEMNVNFKINKNFSLEGVYEVKPSEEENTTTPNSVGADLKYRRSF